jgi:hypothetical protein
VGAAADHGDRAHDRGVHARVMHARDEREAWPGKAGDVREFGDAGGNLGRGATDDFRTQRGLRLLAESRGQRKWTEAPLRPFGIQVFPLHVVMKWPHYLPGTSSLGRPVRPCSAD